MILPLRRKLPTTAPNTAAGKAPERIVSAGRAALCAALVAALALPASAGSNTSAGNSSTNLKWRAAKSSARPADNDLRSADAPADHEAPGDEKAHFRPAKSTTAGWTDGKSTSDTIREPAEAAPTKSVIKVTHEAPVSRTKFTKVDRKETAEREETTARQEIAEPARIEPQPEARPVPPRTRSRVTVERLSEASPSPHSQGMQAAGASSLKILRTSNEEPKIDPFADDLQLSRPEKPATNQRAIQAGLQERSGGRSVREDPFGDEEPSLERIPADSTPDGLPPDEVTQAPSSLPSNCPTPKDYVKRLSDISTNIAAEPGEFPAECGLGDEKFEPRAWSNTLYAWKASALCHKPLYFEDVELERYGQTCSPLFQPLLSAAKFYLTLPILPYKMGLEPPCECIYPLGYYRPGSCAPFIIPPVPISLRAAALEAGVWVAGVALVP